MLENIDDAVKQQLADKGVPTPDTEPMAAAPAAPPSGNGGEDLRGQLAEATAKLKALQHERDVEQARHAQALVDARVKTALAEANKRPESMNSGQVDAQRARLVGQFKNAVWSALPAEKRCEMQGVSGSAGVKDSELKHYFGRGSDSRAATELAKTDPAKYKAWRVIAIERGIF